MPKVEIIPSNNEHDGFMSGHPGLGSVTIRGVVRLSHENKTAIKKVPFVAIRLRGATFTKVRPESEKGLNGPKFKGRWDCHSALPPLVLYGAGSAASSGSEPLLLHPNEVCDLPFEFRISKHEALRNFPSSVILPHVGNLRSRGESRHWLECTINWYRKGGLILAERRVAIEIWIHNITPKTLSGMLLSRTPSTSGFSLAGSMASMSIRSNQSDKDRLVGPPTDPAREKPPQMPTTDTPWDQVALHSRMSSSSLYRISHGRRGSVMTPLPTLGIKWAGEDYSAGVNRRVFTGGERLKLTFQITTPFQGARRPMGAADEDRKGAAEIQPQDPTKHHQVTTPNTIGNNSPRASGEEVGKLKDAAESSNPFGRKATIFPGFSKIISNLRKKKRQASMGPPGAVDTTSHLCNLRVYIEETQTLRAPLEAGDVDRVNEAHQIHVDSFVGNSLSPASAAALPERRSFHLDTAEPNEFHITERHPHFENPADFVRTATGTKKFLCLVHSEAFEGEFGAEQVVEFDLPPIFGAKDLDIIAGDDYEESIQDTPSIRDEADFSSLPRAASVMLPSRGASALSMDRGSKRSYNPSIATTASERQSVIGAKSLKQKRLEKTGRSASRLTQKANLTVKHNDLRRLNSESDQTNVTAIRPTCDHPAISISHELVLELEIPNHGDASESHREIRSGVPASGPLPLAQDDGNQSHDSLEGNRSLNKRLTSMTRSMFQNLIPYRASSTSQTDPTRFHRLKLLSSNSFKSSSDTLRESTASPMTPTPEVYLEAEEEFSVEPLAKGPPRATPPAVLPEQLLATPATVVSAEPGPNGTRKIELRSPVTVSPLNVSECRAIVLDTPSATGADLFGVPLGVLEDEFPGANPDMSRRGSAAAVSVKSRESQISWLNLE